ncbi:Ferredoxin-thioredoxin reductase, variable chain [Tetrabaena socialis]|uniref:Ferredoxin-thioredoxin reductase, variable chain n=1 Tax=Tetrabaena socialis TaxID=47790 RepID=A0A2J8AII8_9CHLO|nr:Ferredoxin-thioredoxin reductase, variable chain [Tetrabaena socialis]PNH12325.1 Ferredoxin-thioredoxin reductase, variable chain [Tetrabaena socialis]|eukprot:PNH02746.1 Ferredoxin-thioredoxin reductase, variable chain [Tetrabaena socialis]
MLATRHSCRASARTACTGRAQLVVRCSGNGSSSLQEGQKVKVVSSVKIYHAPKHPAGIDLNGMEGTLVKDVTHFKGKVLSANLPFKVEFVIPGETKPVKFLAHLGEDELQAL